MRKHNTKMLVFLAMLSILATGSCFMSSLLNPPMKMALSLLGAGGQGTSRNAATAPPTVRAPISSPTPASSIINPTSRQDPTAARSLSSIQDETDTRNGGWAIEQPWNRQAYRQQPGQPCIDCWDARRQTERPWSNNVWDAIPQTVRPWRNAGWDASPEVQSWSNDGWFASPQTVRSWRNNGWDASSQVRPLTNDGWDASPQVRPWSNDRWDASPQTERFWRNDGWDASRQTERSISRQVIRSGPLINRHIFPENRNNVGIIVVKPYLGTGKDDFSIVSNEDFGGQNGRLSVHVRNDPSVRSEHGHLMAKPLRSQWIRNRNYPAGSGSDGGIDLVNPQRLLTPKMRHP